MNERNLIANLIKSLVQKTLGENYSIEQCDVKKNNSQPHKALVICKNGDNMAPTIYIGGLIDEILIGERTMNYAVDAIIKTYHETLPKGFDISSLKDFNCVKDRIIFQIVNTSLNRELLEDSPSIPFLNLSVIFKVTLDSLYDGCYATMHIKSEHLELWGVTKDTVYKYAIKNTPRLFPAEIIQFADIFREDCMKQGVSLPAGEIKADMLPMYILSNKASRYGCSCINYKNVLADFAEELGDDIYIIPSSVHEAILLPVIEVCVGLSELKDMVYSVNRTVLDSEEFLSDNVYLYSRETKQITIAI
ncbi:MAG: hypothetical protein J1E98_01100 [Lachnospiraceae bacterium]|nr:hypothetical protein [Lachnospiraceae bacterium]